MYTLIENGEIYAPEPIGKANLMIGNRGGVLKIGEVDKRSLDGLGLEYEVIDAKGCIVTPGLIDPHEHLLGGSGETGFSSQSPELSATEIVKGGITSVVGCLGVDTTMKTMQGLLGKVKALEEEGLSAFMWTGGYNVPPTTITGTVRNDIMFIEEIIGLGEVAIADKRSMDPTAHELGRLSNEAYVGGMLSRKCGVTHFHVGEKTERMKLLFELLECYEPPPETVYPTHIERSEELMEEAARLTKMGCFVDIDTMEEDLLKQLRIFEDKGGDLGRLTISSDASITPPETVLGQIREAATEFSLEQVLKLATSNIADVLKLKGKGRIEVDGSADVLVLRKNTLELVEVIAGGKRLFKDGSLAFKEKFLHDSKRHVELEGEEQIRTGATGPVAVNGKSKAKGQD